ncbi:MAG: hypothetical protein GWN71_33115, partial [Gammaproteobacteria bacterium]|nr:hypothetical protein [Gemmatimonadota bacterium]NIU78225.1 hypothetical protein [Gammaproteobacteria bacterium]
MRNGARPVLELRCFGPLTIRLGERRVAHAAFQRKKALTLLELLVLKAGNPVTRQALVECLWPGADEKAGVNRLHVVIHALRSVIEPEREERRWIFVRNQGEFYYFNMESPHEIDLYTFRRHAAAARRAEECGRFVDAMAHLEDALALYRGDLFAD